MTAKCPSCKVWLIANRCEKCGFRPGGPPPLPSKEGVPVDALQAPSAVAASSAAVSGKAPRKSSFTFWQEREAEARRLERDKKFGEIGRDTYAALMKASASVASLSASRQSSVRGSNTNNNSTSSRTTTTAVVRSSSSSSSGAPVRASASELESLLETMVNDAAELAVLGDDDDGGADLAIYDNSDPFAFKMAPPPMVSLTGDYASIKEDAEIEAMLASVGIMDADVSFELEPAKVVAVAKPRAATPPPPAEARVPAELRDAVQFLRDCRTQPAAAAHTLQTKRRARHDGVNLEFTFENELAHMKTKEGAAATDGAIAELKKAPPLAPLVLSQALCDACARAYKTKRSGQTTDALEQARLVGKIRGAAKQVVYRSKFSDPLEALMAVFVDDGNADRSRRAIVRMDSGRAAGIAWGRDELDHFLVLVVADSFAD